VSELIGTLLCFTENKIQYIVLKFVIYTKFKNILGAKHVILWVRLCSCIREVLSSNLVRDTGYLTDVFVVFLSPSRKNAWIVSQLGNDRLPSRVALRLYVNHNPMRMPKPIKWRFTGWKVPVWFPPSPGSYSLLRIFQTGSGAHLASHSKGTGGSFSGDETTVAWS
jgi:hypothetical protein